MSGHFDITDLNTFMVKGFRELASFKAVSMCACMRSDLRFTCRNPLRGKGHSGIWRKGRSYRNYRTSVRAADRFNLQTGLALSKPVIPHVLALF